MSVSSLSASTQDYLKAVWQLSEWSEAPVTPKAIADRLGLKMSSVSDAVRKLSTQGLVTHVPYGAVALTEAGRASALAMVRRHRLIEMFLVEVLGYSWDEVHEEAEHLEHAVSETMVARMDKLLGYPTRDPHGDPIPAADGTVVVPKAVPLSQLEEGTTAVVERIADGNSELLQFFEEWGIALGTRITVHPASPFSGAIEVQILNEDPHGEDVPLEPLLLGEAAAEALYVAYEGGSEAVSR